jgi:hypothetical protein
MILPNELCCEVEISHSPAVPVSEGDCQGGSFLFFLITIRSLNTVPGPLKPSSPSRSERVILLYFPGELTSASLSKFSTI